MTDDRACGYVKDDGEACVVDFALCECHGQCFHHSPCRREEAREARRKGAEATNARKREGGGLSLEELPALTSHEAAETWTDAIGRAAATGRLSGAAANAALRAVGQWQEIREKSEAAEKLEEIRRKVEKLTGEGDEAPDLEAL